MSSDDENNALLGQGLNYGSTWSHPPNTEDGFPKALVEEHGAAVHSDGDATNGEAFDDIPQTKRQLGLASVVFLIFNRIIGTGIYATPSIILRSAGSVGMAFVLWLLGASIAAVGTSVYVELGTGLPRNGGEKNYLEFIYRRPKYLITCVFSIYAFITGTNAANSVVFGEYVLHALALTPDRWNTRLVAFIGLTACFFLHGLFLKFGLRVQNVLGIFKLAILCAIALSGVFSLAGVPGFQVKDGYEKSHNLEWDEMWSGTWQGSNAFVTGLYTVIWSFVGYSNANYALSEVKDPVRTIKQAGSIAMISITIVYFFVNLAYFAVVSKSDILSSRQIIVALYVRNLFGTTMERLLSIIIALSLLGNALSVHFTQGRLLQELGREGVLPFSGFLASNKPFDTPLAGLFIHYVLSIICVVLPPPGDAYLFMLNVGSYAMANINTLVALGLFLLYTKPYRAWKWNPPYRTPKITIIIFFLSNVFLVVVPLIPPPKGKGPYEHLPYWSHVLVAFAVSLVGITYWFIRCHWLPRREGYKLERKWVLQDDGVSRYVFTKLR